MTISIPLSRAESLAGLRVVHLDLWWSPQHTQEWPCNARFQDARTLLTLAAESQPAEVAIHEADPSFDDAVQLYEERVKLTASPMTQGSWNYRVSGIFGSKQYHGCWTAREVPLLLVTFAEVATSLVAPHEERRRGGSSDRQFRTILDVLHMLNPEDQERLFDRLLS